MHMIYNTVKNLVKGPSFRLLTMVIPIVNQNGVAWMYMRPKHASKLVTSLVSRAWPYTTLLFVVYKEFLHAFVSQTNLRIETKYRPSMFFGGTDMVKV